MMRNARWLFAVACAIAPAAVRAEPVRTVSVSPGGPVSIIGGTQTTTDEYPSVVVLVFNTANATSLCTGTLITPNWILTAAHCVDPTVLKLASQDAVTAAAEVHFHTLDVMQSPGTVVAARATFMDSKFDPNNLGSHDLGLVELAQEVDDVTPSPINLLPASAPVGVKVTTVGYGSQAANATAGQELQLQDRPTVSCPSLNIGSDANLLCFSDTDGTNTCQGDSGGPSFAMIKNTLTVVGVTSFGDVNCAKFGASTRIDAELDFLATHVPELVGCLQDADCGTGSLCFNHLCYLGPGERTGLGQTCVEATDCASQECAESSQDGKRCSLTCNVGADSACPSGFDCLPSTTSGVGACWPSESAGCCETGVAGGAGGPAAILLGGGVLAVVSRRRRRLP
jgi:V8-like Glu-specific endopeptidase